MHKYFGTDGIRGKVGDFPITPDFALRLGYAAGKVLAAKHAKPTVLIGKDTRLSGYLFESALEAGFTYAGVNVYMVGPMPTPAISYLTRALRLAAGVVISASHNSYEDNGIKFFSSLGSKLADSVESEIEALLDQPMVMAKQLGKVHRLHEAQGRYIEFCKSTVPTNLNFDGIKLVLDCANGATYDVAPRIFEELGAEVIKLACNPDGVNINRQCGSVYPDKLIAKVLECGADYGIGFDGDGDRVVFVGQDGSLFNGDKLVYFLTKLYAKMGHKVAGVVGTVMTNMALEKALLNEGYEFVRAKVGDRYVLEELNKRNWMLGGEASGHILCLDKQATGDGIVIALQVLAGVVSLKTSISESIAWQDYPQVMINVKLRDKQFAWQDVLNDKIEYVRNILGANGRVIVRASGTEALLRIMVEAQDFNQANELAQLIAAEIKE